MTPGTTTVVARRGLVRVTLGILCLLALLAVAGWTLWPMMPAILWSSAIVISTWPVLIWLEARVGGRRWLATAILTLVLTLVLLFPILLGVMAVIDNADRIADWVRSITENPLPEPPPWVERIPFAGERVSAAWREISAAGPQGVMSRLGPYANRVVTWLLSRVGNAGMMILQFALTVIGVVFLYRNGERIGARIVGFARRLAGDEGENAVVLAAQATRSVALGVLLTAIVQALLALLGLWVAGVPALGILTLIMIVTGVAQLGPMPVLIPAVVWLYLAGDPLWGTILLVWSGFVGVIDNVLRPILIRRGADLPMMLIFVGVVGGLIAYGVVGLFIGPVALAVVYRLMEAWVSRGEHVDGASPSPRAPAGG
jgi:predicted PurR-regulated permease PerM